ncbi:tRNA pseudouridine(55) synthase TruB [Rhodobacteraceae bacterium 2CG4]|uniref:tRNA pseudouridine synthase B n=1 Tax=Halovulum marinum TaxID=2662447 RepID=A0A6L5YX73_9RHOB|nr:tRNA pseudouridine(55) synthase TruB [Halovulum marinum]MSU88274.1 tRNA pseudouridine(55) synthase TruB [Halovulum marinum]
MARRKNGRDLTGWLLVDKPAGPTSTDIVNRARWLLQAKKAGHAGTLDPAATGLLVIAFGEATKALPYITDALKAYRFTVAWGAATNTDDAEGEVIETSDRRPTPDRIRAALPAFTGDIEQVPPAFSAVKVDGQRAYALARKGDAPELEARPLFVDRLELIETPDADSAVLEMVCGKGGYVRAIARDLGRELGCLGHTRSLRRLWSGPFSVADGQDEGGQDEGGPALAWSEELTAGQVESALLPLEAGLDELARCRCDQAAYGRLRNGNEAPVISTDAANGDDCWASVGGRPVALGTYRFGHFYPNRVFNLPA